MLEETIVEELIETNNPQPHPFSEIPRLWLKFRKMDENFFRSEVKLARITNTLLGILLYTIFSTLLIFIDTILESMNQSPQSGVEVGIFHNFLPVFLIGVIQLSTAFFLSQFAILILAKVFGGKGDYWSQAYLAMLITVPIGILGNFVSLTKHIPIIGPILYLILTIPLFIQGITLSFRSLKCVHELSNKKTTNLLLLFILIVLLLICILLWQYLPRAL